MATSLDSYFLPGKSVAVSDYYAKHLVGRSLSLRGLAQRAQRQCKSAFEIASRFLRHRGRPVPSRLDELKFYATLGNPSIA